MSGAILLEEESVNGARVNAAVSPVVWLIEDDAARSIRRTVPGITEGETANQITVRLHRIEGSTPRGIAHRTYEAGARDGGSSRSALALALLDELEELSRPAVITAGTNYGSGGSFIQALAARALAFAVELPPSAEILRAAGSCPHTGSGPTKVVDYLRHAVWNRTTVIHPTTGRSVEYLWADLGEVERHGVTGRLHIVQTGRVKRLQPGTIFVFSSGLTDGQAIVPIIGWTRWIRPLVRKSERAARCSNETTLEVAAAEPRPTLTLPLRVNHTLARQQDEAANGMLPLVPDQPALRGVLAANGSALRVGELFGGAGGMGLGFLTASGAVRYQIVCSGEVHPIYVQTLKRNHAEFVQRVRPEHPDMVPESVQPLDLRQPESLAAVELASRTAGGLHVLIGGPPCQGLSTANRNSGAANNPHNELIDVFLNYVERLRPNVFLMENVQGIVWTPKDGNLEQLTVAEDVTRRMAAAGYLVFPKLLDAAWYGVPQHRNRFFVIGISRELGYQPDDFGAWGPFPAPTHWPGTERPYVTVDQAIGDLPRLLNGDHNPEMPYPLDPDRLASNEYLQLMRAGAPEGIIWDHITSRHSAYVLERFDAIPEGGNWEDIKDHLTNYADITRTHSNIYRRLDRNEPSITIGHYRKSMIVHPWQSRGLSLREACRLMSFPDWFRFIGTLDWAPGGITHQQQQLANAVCPLVTRAIAEFISRL